MKKTLLMAVPLSAAVCFGGELKAETADWQAKCQAICDWAVRENLQGALQFVAYKDGKKVVDVWAGTMTTNAGSAKVDGSTLFPIFSTEKPLLETAVHRTVEKGMMDLAKPLCTWWPEFTGEGKEKLTLREALAFRSGMPDSPPGAGLGAKSISTIADWDAMTKWYAAAKPQITPGTKQRYMAVSYAWILGKPLENVWKKPINDVLREQVLIPAGIEKDFYFAADDEALTRIATAYKSECFETMNQEIPRRTCLPSAWAVASARGIAQFYNRLCGFDGREPLVSKATLDDALKPCRHASDPLPDAKTMQEKWFMIFGTGYGLWGEADNMSRVFGHGGVGGSEGLCDRSQRLVVGFTCNFDKDVGRVRSKLYGVVGMKWRYWKDADADIQEIQMSTMKGSK